MSQDRSMQGQVILTGGAGFIGSCFLWKLNDVGITDIIVVDALDSLLKEKNLAGKRFTDFIDKDDFLSQLSRKRFSGVRYIVHMGACSSTILDDPEIYRRDNLEYSKSLGVWAYERKIRYLYASSAATYGDGAQGFDDSDQVTPRLAPLNLYGRSKQDFDLWVLSQGLQRVFAGFKFFNVFGPNEYHKGPMRSIICKNYHSIEQEGKIRLFKSYKPEYEDGGQKRDFIYVKDAVDVMYYFFTHPAVSGIFNVGTGCARTWNDLARAIFRAQGKPAVIEYIGMPPELRSRYQYFTQATVEKLRHAGYQRPFTSLEDAVLDYARYLKADAHL
ncbi:MAG: ADP-glyceromanno-heptose 6-epimerase [Candidatus Omnitrophica bacterium]|nr:ADP-glyceromanno-heptose 6-epimerase [Candidatus Omnitrophota bacterium]